MSEPTIWILAWPSPTEPSASRASLTDTPGAETSHDVPPSKSMPRLRPRVNSETMLMRDEHRRQDEAALPPRAEVDGVLAASGSERSRS